ncbi:nuclear transport factor 2 family protein [Natrarchaeobius chitinivorans]|uniref:DUF3225 domain-containing protein n=1 Tax=Natrarchaeobius chitinivorans TaxID=1679083 RepID=A0A3N6M3N5_NATCH|nr:nuclear transport factor 2 family protein [Natrarchaeobius chitinivorans]RQG98088.1 DUF3225 domain-containing protein [Natrarchaeobius chitinivorans]
MTAHAEDTVHAYYDALRNGDPLESYFRPAGSTVKFGIGEALFGYDDVAEALRSQTETTADWTVESHHLVVGERDRFATFADEVTMAWTDVESETEHRFDTRWSGTLVRESPSDSSDGQPTPASSAMASERTTADWQFATMHVSVADKV